MNSNLGVLQDIDVILLNQNPHIHQKCIGSNFVISIYKCYVFTGSEIESHVSGHINTFVFLMKASYSFVHANIFVTNRCACIRASIIDKQQFNGYIILVQNGINTPMQVFSCIIHGDNNRQKRVIFRI